MIYKMMYIEIAVQPNSLGKCLWCGDGCIHKVTDVDNDDSHIYYCTLFSVWLDKADWCADYPVHRCADCLKIAGVDI